ncbi:superoxide dismutase [Bacillus canaveralius]|uniref:superoxide dismutase n=1 Tax=Bacillus canaveralius TaxID=1403243 RepID=A0A2N5GRM9_9BACI|nr:MULTISPECIES: superoxide dismutase [Bacillus]PLR84574.1 superoxide dismutase [Bacillus sp. V33-4]PLR86088.1 superoxide dismutase [Bacillus canaveralius]PLS00208.1 superoxide dismutase [Bacillus canaveralius]RSK52028.1 superoxide dismutase [Bacillus canaveralius]
MSRFEEYVKSVFVWNKDLKDFLKSQNVQEHEEIWNKLDRFSEIVEGAAKTLSTEELANLQTETNLLHREMEAYFAERQQLGTVWMTGADIEAGKHILPPLPYRYDALEPVISEEIMRIHHDKHHRSYVDGLNKAEIMLKKARESGDFSLVKHWSRELAFHGSGHYLHTIFWNNMSPAGGGRPQGKLLKEIDKYFGSFEAFQKHFSEAAKQVEGVGWALLVWSPRSRHLEILQSERHNLLTQWDTIPILVLDVWEHAYYLQYQNNRAEYVDNWWEIVNWRNAEDRFEKASQLKWRPY